MFVTLAKAGALRGCIGHPLPVLPIGQAIVQAAVSAATEDPRFSAVTRSELADLSYEVTLLDLPRQVEATEVEPGRHGLIVSRGGQRGLLLPQVAVMHNWDAARFLSETCRKAGLPLDAWRLGARIEVFEAEVLSETD